ncbi:MAG TPA: ABC transporter permease [Anaerolineaceae bacterium]|jgi:peptide/nickel transport system permease protein|nr:ABC transporter permease [Anaerolineaceae bacterium]HOU44692.1 ABC transporter permease [Anaerolineaceae bacterium]HQF46257.1 ABC transporter permease [Anaerolineaceae bacterium]HQJ04039.1 ABC transporter permease [Anaerolineaceae bacterium]HQP61662.1 ABC transporter permease [Anaerolineaceae bacterium]
MNKTSTSQWYQVWVRFRKNKSAILGMVIFILLVIIALISPMIYDYNTDIVTQNLRNRLQPPTSEHPLGTDAFGRDVFARIAYGARVSLLIGFIVVGASLVIGGFIGAIAGYFGGILDNVLMRIMDVFLAIPQILLAIAVVAALGPGITNLIIALTISMIPAYARLLRSLILPLKDAEYVEAAKASGTNTWKIIFGHLLPNAMGPLIVNSTLAVGKTIVSAAGMSFLGLGISPPNPEWGAMLSEGKEYIRYAPNLVLYPGMAIMLAVLSLNLLGDGLNDALDPRLKQ